MTFHVRRSWLLVQLGLNGLILGGIAAVAGAVAGGWRAALAFGLIAFALAVAVAAPSVNRRRLIADNSGLVAVRNGFQLRARWDDIVGFDRTRFARVLPVVVLRLNAAAVITGLSGEPLDERMLRRIRKAGADRGIQLSPYVRHLSEGAFADLLREHRPDLASDL